MESEKNGTGNGLLSRTVSRQVSSALKSLTSVFGMGTGVPSSLLSPDPVLERTLKTEPQPPLRGRTAGRAPGVPSKLNNSYQTYLEATGQDLGLLVPASFTCCHASTSGLSTWLSPTGLTLRGKSLLAEGFALRCFQRLSRPYAAARLCTWRYNRYTGGMPVPVLSY